MKLTWPSWLKSPTFWLSLILALGIWLRIDQLDRKIWYFDALDDARDILVAKHIVEHGEVIWRGPFAAGGFFWLQNSPIYYYLLAGAWWLTRSPEGVVLCWAVFSSFGIILSYWAGKLTRDSLTGLVLALIYSVHPSLVLNASQILQPHILPIFTLTGYICLIMAWKKQAGGWLIGAISAMLFPLHIHYGIIILYPIFGLATGYLVWRMIKKRWSNWPANLIYLISAGWVFGLSWVLLTFRYKPFDQLRIFELNQTATGDVFQVRLTETIARASELLFVNLPVWGWVMVGITSLSLGLITQIQIKKSQKPLWYWLLAIILISSSTVFIFRGYIANTYLLGLMPFYLLYFALAIRTLWSMNKWLGMLALGLISGWYSYQSNLNFERDFPKYGFAPHFKAGSRAIYDDYQKLAPNSNQPPNFVITALSCFADITLDAWSVGAYWFYLEDLFNQRLVKLTDYDVSFWPIASQPDYVYLACDHRWQPEKEQANCYQKFTKVRNNIDRGQQIFRDETQTIWRFKIKPGTQHQPWWYLYWKK